MSAIHAPMFSTGLREVLRIEFNGTNGSQTITDSHGHTITVAGNTQVSTAQSVYGGASGLFDGTGDYLWLDDSDDWNLDAGFELYFDLYANSIVNRYGIAGQCDNIGRGTSSNFQIYGSFGSLGFNIYYDDGTSATLVDASFAATTWTNYKLTKTGNSITLKKNGTIIDSTDSTGKTIRNSTYKLGIGSLGEYVSEPANTTFGTLLNGYIDRFVLSVK